MFLVCSSTAVTLQVGRNEGVEAAVIAREIVSFNRDGAQKVFV